MVRRALSGLILVSQFCFNKQANLQVCNVQTKRLNSVLSKSSWEFWGESVLFLFLHSYGSLLILKISTFLFSLLFSKGFMKAYLLCSTHSLLPLSLTVPLTLVHSPSCPIILLLASTSMSYIHE